MQQRYVLFLNLKTVEPILPQVSIMIPILLHFSHRGTSFTQVKQVL